MKTRFATFITGLMPAMLLLSLSNSAVAAETLVGGPVPVPMGLTVLDWGIIAAYVVGTLGIGVYFSLRAESTQEYFTGNGHMNPFLIGISLFVTLLSTISYLSMPGEVVGKGPVYLTRIFAYPCAFLVIGFVLLPVYMRQRVTSAYQLLEDQLGLSVRLLGAVLFVVLRLVWMSLVVYMAANAMIVMMGLEERWIPLIVAITGLITVIYTSMGGVRAVVITDCLQALLLFGGAVLVLGVVTWRVGGLDWLAFSWHDHWDHQPFFSFDPAVRVSVFGTFLSTALYLICVAGGDQTSVQRFMATQNARAARQAAGFQFLAATLVSLTLGLVGLALLHYFQQFTATLPAEFSLTKNADDLFPWFIAYQLPAGISGLVVAAMFAAAMSSLDSGVNSITAVVLTDFCDRFGFRPQTEKGHLRAARWLAFSIGALIVLISTQMGKVPGNITAVTTKTANLLTPTVFCLFFFALFVPFARPLGVWAGAIAGTITAVLLAFPELWLEVNPATGASPISFQWITPGSLLVNLAVGLIVSWMLASTAVESTEVDPAVSAETSS